MARNTINIRASREAVFGVLADPRGYAYWVLGSLHVRSADSNWPQVGSTFDHTVGLGPLHRRDRTTVEESRRPEFLQLSARARPFGSARVTLELSEEDGGTLVTMTESPATTASAFLFQPLTHLLVRARNRRSLDRLRELAEGAVSIPEGRLPGRDEADDGSGAVRNPAQVDRERRGTSFDLAAPKILRGACAGAVAGALATFGASALTTGLIDRSKRGGWVLPRLRNHQASLEIAGHLLPAGLGGAAGAVVGATMAFGALIVAGKSSSSEIEDP